ncbi:hypothetical protein N431DRAFT_545911 [Stipitochalara longipes BDJ]|nr:hypothetical protein N431DRAFT_545911 [Stipitochalara longipes BDJ]
MRQNRFKHYLNTISTWNSYLNRILPPLSSIIGLLAIGGGIQSLLNPLAFSSTLGIPLSTTSSSTSESIPFISLIGARNLSSGLTVLPLLYVEQRKAVGILFMCGVVTAVLDAWICAKYGGSEGKAVGHAVMGLAFGAVGAGMVWLYSLGGPFLD